MNEAVESFLRQDYAGDAELVVLNDFAKQTFVFEHPRVKVVNRSERYVTLGEKRHAGYLLAEGDIFITWGDDDIHLPHRITRLVAHLGEDAMCFEGWYYALMHDGLFLEKRSTAGAMAVRASAYRNWGGIPPLSVGEDVAFNAVAQKRMAPKLIRGCREAPAFMYRWHGTRRKHVSGTSSEDPYQHMLEQAEKLIASGEEPNGLIEINPHWVEDYVESVKRAKLR